MSTIEMTQEERDSWDRRAKICGFATVEQQERLTRIFNALRDSIEAEKDGPYGEFGSYVERSFSGSRWTLNQDAHRVSAQFDGGAVTGTWFYWKYDGTFVCADSMTGKVTSDRAAKVLADALGRLA